jgi:hypothetical protein
MPYVEVDCAPGTAAGIARFYTEVLAAPATLGTDAADGGSSFVRIAIGLAQSLVFRETTRALPPYDGHHVQVSVADFSGVHRRLLARGLVTEESDQHQYRFQDIVDVDSGRVLATLEHEVRSMRHPMYARHLVNRNLANDADAFVAGYEEAAWRLPPTDNAG